MSRRQVMIAFVLSAMVLALAGCGAKSSEAPTGKHLDRKGRGNVLSLALAATPKNVDPIKYTGVYEGNIIINVADTIVRYKSDLSDIVPNLAVSWQVSPDGKDYTFKLRDDVYFQKGSYQDGKKMTAADIKYSLERSATKSAMNRLSMLASVDIVNDYEVVCHLKAPNSAFLTVLTDAGNVIVPKEEVEGWGDSFTTHLVGTGPFALKEFKNDQEAILVRNDKYWGEKPNLDGLRYVFITDTNQMINALRSGEIDMATDIKGEGVKLVQDDPNLVLQQVPGLHVAYVYMNLMKGPTADIRVRKAILQAVNIDEMIKGIYPYNEGQRAYLPLPPGSWGYDASLESLIPKYDPEAAKKLLAEAGYPNGFKTEIYIGNTPARVKMATILQSFLKQNLNIDLEIKTAEWGTFSEVASKGNAPMYGMSWTWYPDPFFFLNKMFHSSEIGALGNGQGYKNEKVDSLLNEALKITDVQKRAALYKEALKIIVENYSRIDYANEKVIYGFNPAVQGFTMRPDNTIIFVSPESNVSLSK